MKLIKELLKWLGSLYLALLLIAITACVVAAGTFLEAHYNSHHFAAYHTFNSLPFALLLFGFFINILAAALKRWPWRQSHLPFLLAHLGLLLLLSGVIIKLQFGLQGHLGLIEGTGKDRLLINDSYAIRVEKRRTTAGREETVGYFPFDPSKWNGRPMRLHSKEPGFEALELTVTDYAVNSQTKPLSWTSNDALTFKGMKAIPLRLPEDFEVNHYQLLPLQRNDKPHWHVYAVKNAKPHLIQKLLETSAQLEIKRRSDGYLLASFPLKTLLNGGDEVDGLEIKGNLALSEEPCHFDLSFSLISGLSKESEKARFELSLEAPKITQPKHYELTLKAPPTLLCNLNEEDNSLTFFAFDSEGLLHISETSNESLTSLYAYDKGFQGYTLRHLLPFPLYPYGQEMRKKAHLHQLSSTLREQLQQNQELIPPLKLFQESCKHHQLDFATSLIHFFEVWGRSGEEFCPLEQLAPDEVIAVQGIAWPHEDLDAAHLFSKALNYYGLTPNFVLQEPQESNWRSELLNWHATQGTEGICEEDLELEADLQLQISPLPSFKRWEDNIPMITCAIKIGEKSKTTQLTFDRQGSELAWPLADYLLRFQPIEKKLPFQIRLHSAHRINYPNSGQPQSYNCTLWISLNNEEEELFTELSMNATWEGKGGERIYLANITPGTPGALQRVQLIVNKDPAKYWLTYPGALLLTLGMLLLLTKRILRQRICSE